MTTLGVLCCFALFVCLTLLASFFLPSHLSFKNMYIIQSHESQVKSAGQLNLLNYIVHVFYYMYSCISVSSVYSKPIRRENSRDILQGKANGTFLVRPKADVRPNGTDPVHCHTIDIM